MRYDEKGDDFEAFLARLNAAARAITPDEIDDAPPASAQIVGLPRTGTTLMYQLLARTGEVGYPSNVMAFFHEAPWVGAHLHRQLAAQDPTTSFDSVGGRTPEPLDPHEFGYFWRRVCGHSANSLVQGGSGLDVASLKAELDLVATVFRKPVVYKNFLAMVHAPAMRSFGVSSFVVVKRDARDVAASLLALRQRLGVAPTAPFGVQPSVQPGHSSSALETVAWQVAALEQDLAGASLTSDQDVQVVDYVDLCHAPRTVCGDVLSMLGADTAGVSRLPIRISPSAPSDALDAEEQHELELALDDARNRLMSQEKKQ